MATRFDVHETIARPADRVLDALCDPAFYETLGELPAIGPPQLLEREEVGDSLRLHTRYRLTAELPSAARRFVQPERLTWTDETVVDRTNRRATFRIVPDHYRNLLRCDGAWSLDADGERTVQHLEGVVTVRIPVVGRLAERGIVRGLREHLSHEARLLESWLEPSP